MEHFIAWQWGSRRRRARPDTDCDASGVLDVRKLDRLRCQWCPRCLKDQRCRTTSLKTPLVWTSTERCPDQPSVLEKKPPSGTSAAPRLSPEVALMLLRHQSSRSRHIDLWTCTRLRHRSFHPPWTGQSVCDGDSGDDEAANAAHMPGYG